MLFPGCSSLAVGFPSQPCWGWWVHGFCHQQPWEAIRYLEISHSLHLAIQPFVFLPRSHRVSSQALFCIDWSQLSHHLLWINFPVSFFHLSIFPVLCSWPTYLNCARAFLRNCAEGRCCLVRWNWFNFRKWGLYIILSLIQIAALASYRTSCYPTVGRRAPFYLEFNLGYACLAFAGWKKDQVSLIRSLLRKIAYLI